ncbi:hypothetical protein AB4Z10_17030 [Bosea sp. RAF48]|uniref:hypothetical protein n=1 Tax=Bosea sp. RAF48 TaxID=3237480 RepID=UPI003F93BAC6
MDVKPTVEEYTVAMPWYEPEDFPVLWELAQDRSEMPPRYEDWRRSAETVMNAWLARGRALQIVTIRPGPFVAWLEARHLPNTAEIRRRYVEDLATRDHDAA